MKVTNKLNSCFLTCGELLDTFDNQQLDTCHMSMLILRDNQTPQLDAQGPMTIHHIRDVVRSLGLSDRSDS